MPANRPASYVLFACAAAVVFLLALHPGGATHDLQGLVQMEAAQQGPNALVHGGFILLLPLIIAGHAVLARALGLGRFAVLAGLMFFCIGVGFLAASLLVDGLLVPQMAARLLAGPPERIEGARGVFLLAGTAVRILMPLGLGMQAFGGAILAITALRLNRGVAVAGFLACLAALAGVALQPAQPIALMAAIGLVAVVWNAIGGVLLLAAPTPDN